MHSGNLAKFQSKTKEKLKRIQIYGEIQAGFYTWS